MLGELVEYSYDGWGVMLGPCVEMQQEARCVPVMLHRSECQGHRATMHMPEVGRNVDVSVW
jgi:hypothetical protein